MKEKRLAHEVMVAEIVRLVEYLEKYGQETMNSARLDAISVLTKMLGRIEIAKKHRKEVCDALEKLKDKNRRDVFFQNDLAHSIAEIKKQ